MDRVGKPVQGDGKHSASRLSISEKELSLETGLENIWCGCAILLLCIFHQYKLVPNQKCQNSSWSVFYSLLQRKDRSN